MKETKNNKTIITSMISNFVVLLYVGYILIDKSSWELWTIIPLLIYAMFTIFALMSSEER